MTLDLNVVVDFRVFVLEPGGREETIRTKKPFIMGMKPPASVYKTVRAVLIKGRVLTGTDDCVCWVLFFLLSVYYIDMFVDEAYLLWKRFNRILLLVSKMVV